ncbi:MAG: exo-alpha-sialidase, partial [Cyclobacteriaceae bacterium]|nr:exo-alpha-sialidase [Cyclobacteriaceae bacterium]
MKIKKLTFFVIIIVLSGFYVNAQKEIFVNGEGSHPCYRIPAITKAKNGDIVAFVEGRRTMHDHANNDLVIRRSSDNGNSWSRYQVIFKNENVMVNPSPV